MNFKTGVTIFSLSFKEALAYRAGMMFSIITFPISMLVAFFIWTSIFEATGSTIIGGFTLDEMIGYYIISLLVIALIWNPIMDDLHKGVRRGDFIKFITKPLSYPFYALFHALGGRSLAFLIEFVPIVVIMSLLLDVSYLTTANFGLFMFSLSIAFVIYYLISLLMGSLIFWLTNPTGIAWLYRLFRYVLAGGLIPLTFFPETFQRILLFTPFPHTTYIPAAIFVGNTSFAGIELSYSTLLLYSVGQLIFMILLVYFVWKKAVTKFQGVGA